MQEEVGDSLPQKGSTRVSFDIVEEDSSDGAAAKGQPVKRALTKPVRSPEEQWSKHTRDRLQDMARRTFKKYDRKKNGKLDADEFGELISALCFSLGIDQPDEAARTKALEHMDTNKNGTIELPEFEEWWMRVYCPANVKVDLAKEGEAKKRGEDVESEARALFLAHDKDQSGYLEFPEFCGFVTSLTESLGLPTPSEKVLKDAMEVVDSAEDHRISYAEFNEWWMQSYDDIF